MIIAQEKVLSMVNSWTLDTLPHSLLLIGDSGCGKHELVKYISNKFNLGITVISESITDELIESILLKVYPSIYLIDVQEITNAEQNKLLKFLEEPNEQSYIVLLSESSMSILPTIKNRCFSIVFSAYTDDVLETFIVDKNKSKEILKYARTPGQVIMLQDSVLSYVSDAEKIFSYIDKALLSNILVLPDKLVYKSSDSGLYVTLFAKILHLVAFEFYTGNRIGYKTFLITSEFYNNCSSGKYDKKKLYIKYLMDIKNDIRNFKTANSK